MRWDAGWSHPTGRRSGRSVWASRPASFGIHTMIERHVKRLLPATAATHLLRAGVDVNTIRAWLGHISLNTTNIYAEVDMEMKSKALATCEVRTAQPQKHWREDTD